MKLFKCKAYNSSFSSSSSSVSSSSCGRMSTLKSSEKPLSSFPEILFSSKSSEERRHRSALTTIKLFARKERERVARKNSLKVLLSVRVLDVSRRSRVVL